MRGSETQVFDGKTLSELLKDIYDISSEKRRDIKALIKEMSKLVTTTDAIVQIAPIIQQYFEVSVKNDEQLTKIASIVQRVINADAYGNSGGDPSELLSEEEKQQLLNSATQELKKTTEEIQNELEDLVNQGTK